MCHHNFAPDKDALMVVPEYATGSTSEGTRQYTWTTSRGRGVSRDGSQWFAPDVAERLAAEATKRNDPF